MNAPLPLPAIAPAAPTSIADALGAKSAPVNKKGPSFSDVLAQQRSAQSRPSQAADSRPANNGAKTSADGKNSGDPAARAEGAAASAIDEAVQTAAQAEAGALAVAVAQPALILPQQALEIAAQAAEQVQLARGNAAAAAAAMSSGAAVLTAALNAADAAPATPAAQAASAAAAAAGAGAFTAPQAEAAAALAAREAEIAVPVITAAAKPGTDAATTVQAPVRALAAAAPVKAETPRLAAEVALPRPARDVRPETGHIAMPEQADDAEAQVLASAQQQFQAPQHGASAQDHLAQALAAATQRPAAAPIANPAAVAAPVVPVMLQVATPVGGTHWGTELGQQVVMMSHGARQGMQTAELRLDPPDLGPLRVSLNLSDGVASASFVSAHASVRQAIETAIPQLQQALAQAGISLGQTSVGEQAAQQEFAQQGGNGSQRHAGGGQAGADSVAEAPVAVTTPRNANALVDTFA